MILEVVMKLADLLLPLHRLPGGGVDTDLFGVEIPLVLEVGIDVSPYPFPQINTISVNFTKGLKIVTVEYLRACNL